MLLDLTRQPVAPVRCISFCKMPWAPLSQNVSEPPPRNSDRPRSASKGMREPGFSLLVLRASVPAFSPDVGPGFVSLEVYHFGVLFKKNNITL